MLVNHHKINTRTKSGSWHAPAGSLSGSTVRNTKSKMESTFDFQTGSLIPTVNAKVFCTRISSGLVWESQTNFMHSDSNSEYLEADLNNCTRSM